MEQVKNIIYLAKRIGYFNSVQINSRFIMCKAICFSFKECIRYIVVRISLHVICNTTTPWIVLLASGLYAAD